MAKRYEIFHPDGSRLSVEGELVHRDDQRIILDGQGKPWLLLLEQDVVRLVADKRESRGGKDKPN